MELHARAMSDSCPSHALQFIFMSFHFRFMPRAPKPHNNTTTHSIIDSGFKTSILDLKFRKVERVSNALASPIHDRFMSDSCPIHVRFMSDSCPLMSFHAIS